MSFSIQTNVNSLVAQENLRVNSNFQSLTIQRLTSGFRINASGDDAAGLAIANKFRSDVAELSQGVRNANDGISTLQIIDGGMNNVSKMLDRLRTLATQSASDTFTGNRAVLNSEFQSLLTEIDRQSQSIGLDTNGQFARQLSVFIGGGKSSGAGAISTSNGTVTMDLRTSSVDSQSLGLKGMQVLANPTVDIGTGSSTHTVAQIVADVANTTAAAGFSDMYISGAGFSDSSKVKVSINLSSVTNVTTLATAVNAALQAAGNVNTQAAAAFKSANIVASVNTSSTGVQSLAFTSSTAAFQVEAGDRMANALLGNLSGTTGTAISTTTVGATTAAAGAFVPTNVTVRISGGGLSSAQDITFAAGVNTVDLAITSLTSSVAANAALKAAGITVSGGAAGSGPLTFTSARGEKVTVSATGDTANKLGLGTFIAGAAGAADYTTLTAGAAYANGTAFGTAVLGFSINGAASSSNLVSVNLDAGDSTAALKAATADSDQHGNTVTFSIDGAAAVSVTLAVGDVNASLAATKINATGGINVTATVNASGFLQITSNTKGAHTLTIAGTNTYAGLNGVYTGAGRTGANLQDAINSVFASNSTLQQAGLQATVSANVLTVASSNGTFFRVNTGTSGASADVGLGVAGASFAGLTVNNSAVSVADANGASGTTAISYAALANGSDDQALSISADDSSGSVQSKTITLQNDTTARNGRSIDETISYINTQLQQSNNATLQKIVAVKERSGANEQINFISSLGKFSVGLGSSANGNGLNSGAAVAESGTVQGASANVAIDSQAGAAQAVTAVATAIGTLGSAQAAVGKGQNQLGYAVGLANSQIGNFSAAESRIRDADVAMEAANLTKAQVLLQASMAAMAQANSAPQAVLALLRG